MSRYYDMGGAVTLPGMVELDPIETCNLRCRMCHVSFMPQEKRPLFDVALVERLAALKGCYMAVGSGFEPML